MPRLLLSALLAVALAPPAEARPNTTTMSCNQARSLVRAHGGIVLSTGRYTYDRYVAAPYYCDQDEWGRAASVPTLSGSCPVGYICKPAFLEFEYP